MALGHRGFPFWDGGDNLLFALVLGLRHELFMIFGGLWLFCVLLIVGSNLVLAVCPHCFDNQAGCTFGSDGQCPALGEVTLNTAIIGRRFTPHTLPYTIKS